jgi:ubiquinone/menaquinone biosynthesis C-methylase UbiE
MSKAKRAYYNEFYANKDVRKSPLPKLTALSHKLQRFALPANQLIFKLLTPGDRLLDIGCGDGDFALLAKNKFKEVFGVDISPIAIQRCNIKIANRIDKDYFHFLVHDVDEGLPFNDSYFDAVTCIALLEHIIYPPSLLKEIRRVLKNRGELVILVPNDAWLVYRLQSLVGKIPQSGGVDEIGVDWGHFHKFNKEIAINLLLSNGYRVTNVYCSGVFSKVRSLWLSLLASDIIIKSIVLK